MPKVRLIALKHHSQPWRYQLVHWFVKRYIKEDYAHCGIQVNDAFYELTELGVGMCTIDKLAEDKDLESVFTSYFRDIPYRDIAEYAIIINALIMTETKTHYVDFLKYAYCVLKGKRYYGRPLCTGFVELVIGASMKNATPQALIKEWNEQATRESQG